MGSSDHQHFRPRRRRGLDGGRNDPGATASLAAPVLVVEDDQTTCDVVRAYLESAGYRVVVCRSGAEALGFVRQTQPRCLILDVMLPGKDGFEICADIRRSGSIVPILFLSARADEPDRVDGLRVGADDYLVKPFSPANSWRASTHSCDARRSARDHRQSSSSATSSSHPRDTTSSSKDGSSR